MQPLFSIIVPVYNIEKYLEECLESIHAQTFPDFELILVNDGATDKSAYICDEYAKSNANAKVIHKSNGGLVSARIEGLRNAIGKYIVCIDGDDWVDPNYLETFHGIINETSVDVVCSGYISEMPGKSSISPITEVDALYSREDIIRKIHPYVIEDINGKSFSKSVWAKAFKRELYAKYQLNVPAQLKIGEDAACVKPCIYNANSIYVSAKCMYHYRYNPASMTKNRKPFDWMGPKLIAESYMKGMDNPSEDIKAQIYRETVHNLFNICKSCFYQEKTYSQIKKEILSYLENDFYKECIDKATYSKSIKHVIALYSLKYKLIELIRIYSRITR